MAIEKLYPPKIDNILPAFTTNSDGVYEMLIPFYLNQSVGYNDYTSISYVVKSAISDKEIATGTIENNGYYNEDKKRYEILLQFSTDESNMIKKGQYYKIQIAFNNGNVGYYSSVGVSKCINQPTINVTQSGLGEIIGTFVDKETKEKVYSYTFNLYNENNILLETSGELLHNSINDINGDHSDHWEIQTSLKSDVPYWVTYSVTTSNNYFIESKPFKLMYYETVLPRIENAILKVDNNFEEGYNKIYLYRHLATTKKLKVRGNFYLLRASHKDNYSSWERIADFQIYDWIYDINNPIYDIYKDYFIEQGINYRYAIQAYSNAENDQGKIKIYSSKLLNDEGPIHSDFEDIFLYDGERQLKIRFNPKIGSFKQNVLESKVDTIGGQYPYFFRNGNTNYKEFSLSGLISMISDENNEFNLISPDYSLPFGPSLQPFRDDTFSRAEIKNYSYSNLSSYNYQKEREFKLQVLSWLTNGKEKILKTPAEGNYIVRLMNTTLSPNDTLGRMLHSFTSTVYEITDYNLTNLKNLGFLEKSNPYYRKFITRKLLNDPKNNVFNGDLIIDKVIIYAAPDQEIKYRLNGDTEDRKKTTDDYGILNLSEEESDLNEKGLYSLQGNTWKNVDKIEYSYLNKVKNIKDWYWIYNVVLGKLKLTDEQGQGTDISMKNYLNEKNVTVNENKEIVQDIISSFPYVEIKKRNEKIIYKINNKYYSTSKGKNEIDKNFIDTNKQDIFKIIDTNIYVIPTIVNDKIQYKEVSAEEGVFWIKTESIAGKKLTYLGDLGSDTIVYRDLQDLRLGQGLIIQSGTAPKKTITIKDNSKISYAI